MPESVVERPTAGAEPRRKVTWLEYVAAAVAAAYVIVYLVIAIRRLGHPFDLEWMEGSSVDHVRRILAGERLYVRPSLAFIPFPYPPLYYYVSAVVSLVTGVGLLPLRLVSFASSLGCFWLVYRLVERETRSWYAGLIAVGTFAATYRIGGAWFDLARIDSLFLLLCLAALFFLRFADSPKSWGAAGILLAGAALTKQTGLFIAVPLFCYAAIANWRRAPIFVAGFAAVFGGVSLALDAWQNGWYFYHTIRLPARIQAAGGVDVDFWKEDLFLAMPVASALAGGYLMSRPLTSRGSTVFYVFFALALIGSTWAARVHLGAYDNVLIPAYACLAVFAGLAIGHLSRTAAQAERPALRTFLATICLIQFAALAYSPRAQLPNQSDRELLDRLLTEIGSVNGEVYMPHHGYYSTLAGKPSHAHAWAVFDLLLAGEPDIQQALRHEIHHAIDQQRFALIVLDRMDTWLEAELNRRYRRVGPVLHREGLRTVTGYLTSPRWLYVPQ